MRFVRLAKLVVDAAQRHVRQLDYAAIIVADRLWTSRNRGKHRFRFGQLAQPDVGRTDKITSTQRVRIAVWHRLHQRQDVGIGGAEKLILATTIRRAGQLFRSRNIPQSGQPLFGALVAAQLGRALQKTQQRGLLLLRTDRAR